MYIAIYRCYFTPHISGFWAHLVGTVLYFSRISVPSSDFHSKTSLKDLGWNLNYEITPFQDDMSHKWCKNKQQTSRWAVGAAHSDCKAPRSIREFSSKFRVTSHVAKGALKSPHNIAGPQTPSKRKRAHSRTLQFSAYRSDPGGAEGKRYTMTMWTGTCPHCTRHKWIWPPSQTCASYIIQARCCELSTISLILLTAFKKKRSQFSFQKIIGPCHFGIIQKSFLLPLKISLLLLSSFTFHLSPFFNVKHTLGCHPFILVGFF